MGVNYQEQFDLMIGRLDRILSEMLDQGLILRLSVGNPNVQTLKHHAEDMIGAGHKILKNLGYEDGR